MKHATIILLLLAVAGCRMETANTSSTPPIDVIVTYSDAAYNEMLVKRGAGGAKFGGGVTVEYFNDDVVRVDIGRFRPSEVDSAYSAGFSDGWANKLSGALEECAKRHARRDTSRVVVRNAKGDSIGSGTQIWDLDALDRLNSSDRVKRPTERTRP